MDVGLFDKDLQSERTAARLFAQRVRQAGLTGAPKVSTGGQSNSGQAIPVCPPHFYSHFLRTEHGFFSAGPAAETNAPLVFPAPRGQRGPCKKHGINEKDGPGNPDVMALHNPPPYQPPGAGPKPALPLGMFTDFP